MRCFFFYRLAEFGVSIFPSVIPLLFCLMLFVCFRQKFSRNNLQDALEEAVEQAAETCDEFLNLYKDVSSSSKDAHCIFLCGVVSVCLSCRVVSWCRVVAQSGNPVLFRFGRFRRKRLTTPPFARSTPSCARSITRKLPYWWVFFVLLSFLFFFLLLVCQCACVLTQQLHASQELHASDFLPPFRCLSLCCASPGNAEERPSVK